MFIVVLFIRLLKNMMWTGWEGLQDHKTGRPETVLNAKSADKIIELRKQYGYGGDKGTGNRFLVPVETGEFYIIPECRKTPKILNISVPLNVSMAIKSLTITESAYDVLKRLKYGDESFSDAIIRIGQEKTVDVKKYFGILKGGEIKARKLIGDIKKRRIEFDKSFEKKLSKLKKIRGN